MSAPDLDAIEARARRDVVTCDECDAPATRVCNASECGATRCDAHAVEYSGHCDHRWYPRRSLAAEVLALVALARATADNPLLDGTDGAHPAWWRGHDRAADMLTAQRDAALADAARARAAYAQDLDGLRAEVRRADDERATWRDLRDAARECLDALEAPAPVWDADESEHDEHAARLEVAHAALRALVGGAS